MVFQAQQSEMPAKDGGIRYRIELERKAERRPNPETRSVLAVKKKVLAADRLSLSLSMLSMYVLY